MTTQKKLLALGAVTGILLIAFVSLPDSLKGKSLSSSLIAGISDPTNDQQIVHDWSTSGVKYPGDIVVYKNIVYVADRWNDRIKKFNLSGESQGVFGSVGNNNGQFNNPTGIAIDTKNEIIYVADTTNNRIQKFTLAGAYIGKFGSAGTANGEFSMPTAIEIDEKNGFIYVADTHNHRVQKFNLAGQYLGKVGSTPAGTNNSHFNAPNDIALDASGNVYVADTYNDRIQKFNSSLVYVDTIGSNGTANGTFLRPHGIAIDSVGFLYVSDTGNDRIQKLTTSGTFVSKIGSEGTTAGKFNAPRGIATDENKNIYVADRDNDRIQKFQQHIITPTKPLNLVADAGNGQVNLTWTASSTRTGGSPILDYRFEYRKVGTTDWSSFANGVTTATRVSITGLNNDVDYEFRVFAVNTFKEVSPSSARVTATPTSDDKCNNIVDTQESVPQRTKRNSNGNCTCINNGQNPPTCTLTCPAGAVPAEPEFKIVYDAGYPKMYANIKDTVGVSSAENSTMILSTGETLLENVWTPLFKANGQPIYDPTILKDKNQLSLQKSGNTLRVLLYGNRTDDKIEHVRGKVYIRGGDVKWSPTISDITLDEGGKGVNSAANDFARVLTDPTILQFDLAVTEDSDSFLAKYDLSSGCVDVPPTVTTFTVPQNSKTRTIPLTFTVSETTGIDYLITESATKPSAANSAGWQDAKPTTYTVTSDGTKTLYAWARRNIAGRDVLVSSARASDIVIVDTAAPTAPIITAPAANTTLTIAASIFTGTAEAGSTIKITYGTAASDVLTATAHATTGAYSIPMTESLANGIYTISVTATDVVGNVSPATTRTFTIDVIVPDTDAPTQPSAIIASNITQTSVTLSWGASTDNVAVAKYIIYRNTIEVGTSVGTTFIDTGLTAGTTYSYTVKARDAKPNLSSASVALSVTTEAVISLAVDNDCDGINDAWEIRHGYSITDRSLPSDTIDTDADGHSDKKEGLYGTNPKSGAAPLPGQYETQVGASTVTLSFQSYLGNLYSFQRSVNLTTWTEFASNITGTGSVIARTHDKIASSEFYRLNAHSVACTDTVAPIVSSFTVTSSPTSFTLAVTNFGVNEVAVKYLITESSTPPLANAAGWSSVTPTTYTVDSAGAQTLYAWAQDIAGNISEARIATVTVTIATPVVTAFVLPTTSATKTVPITTFTLNATGISYLITESSTPPLANAAGWLTNAPTTYVVSNDGLKTLYAWTKNIAGDISVSKSAQVTVNTFVPTLTATPGNGQVSLTWSALAANGDVDVADYGIEYKVSTNATWSIFSDGVSVNRFATVNSLTNRTSYIFRISSKNTAATTLASVDSLPVTPVAPDAAMPTILKVTSTKSDGSYKAGTLIPISVEFSESVIVTGVPRITLETGTTDAVVNYSSGTSSNTIIFDYIVLPGHTSLDLSVTSLNLTAENTIKDVDGHNVVSVLPTTDDTTFSGTKNIIVDTTAPAESTKPMVPTQTGIITNTALDGFTVSTTNPISLNVSCVTGDKVKLYNGITVITTYAGVTSTPCVSNTATIQITLPNNVNYYSLYATNIDTAGNESNPSPMISFFRNASTVSNAPGTPDLESLDDLGSSSIDNFTSSTRPRFTIACTSGAIVTLYTKFELSLVNTPIGTAPCVAGTAQVFPGEEPFLHAGMHTVTAKQSINGTTSSASGALVLTIDTTPLTVVLELSSIQINPNRITSVPNVGFIATFNRTIDSNSFVCSDVTVVNGSCNGITTLSEGTTYLINVRASIQGLVKATIYAGRVQTPAGNLNTESTGSNTVTYGTAAATAECSSLRKFTTSAPKSTSLNGQTLCKTGTASNVSYSSSELKWTYQCRNTTDDTTASCTVGALLDSAPTCALKSVDELPFDDCSIGSTSNMFNFHKYLSCLDIVPERESCTDAGCTQNAKRQELISIGVRLRGIPLESDYKCQKSHTDTVRGVSSWVCEAAEKAQIAGLISQTNRQFRPLDTMTRSEAYSVLMKSICIHPETTYKNWQTEVAKAAKEYGFTTRTVATFEPNRQILRQELYVLAARLAEYSAENPGTCDELPEELICE